MPKLSVFNDVLGPIMVGPSSSHTAGTARVGLMSRALLGEAVKQATLTFDPGGSLAYTYRGQGSDRGYTGGLMSMEPDNPDLGRSLELASQAGLSIRFEVAALEAAEHPNDTRLHLTGVTGRKVEVRGASTGGGMMRITRVNGYPLDLAGDDHELLVEGEGITWAAVAPLLERAGVGAWSHSLVERDRGALLNAKLDRPLPGELRPALESLPGVRWTAYAPPVVPVAARPSAEPLFQGASAMVVWAEQRGRSLGDAARAYELNRSGWSEEQAQAHMDRIWAVMERAARRGLTEELDLFGGLVRPSAQRIRDAAGSGRLLGGPVSMAVAYSTAVMEVSNSMGVVVAAPTAGAAGVIPGVMLAAADQMGPSREQLLQALWAAGAIGLVIARKATFAAEVAGCQAEVGAASAMAAAGLVELAGGTPRQAEEAASIALQNSLGMICDPVAGLVQVPCYGKNAMGAGNAFASADMALGGYRALVPFDEVAEAMLRVGQAMPREVRCTSLGGLATTPTGLELKEQVERWVRVRLSEDLM